MKRLAIILAFILVPTILAGCTSSEAKKNDNKLVIGVDDKMAPLGFRDENNKLAGFDIDYAKAAAKEMGKEAQFQPIDWSTKESELNSDRIDLIWNGYTITDERSKKVLFTKPYLENRQVIATLADSKIQTLQDLNGKVIGLQSLSSAGDALDKSPIKDKVKKVSEFADNVTALNDLKNGRLDAVVIDEVVIDYYMAHEKNTFKVLDHSLASEKYGIGVKKGNGKLLKSLQQALDKLNKDGTADKVSEKWFGEDKILK
ncbi:amino acid ABC transporter substrate-binding protein [Virgibacillus halophilus]|uniref:amino acid ABC transporter substrate-binding protein n=1 Tax=Tigheibacillus halophilus TaxID=361280 RepID=UPI00362984E3